MELPAIRARFPALAAAGPDGRPAVHADAPGGTQMVDSAIEAMASYLRAGTANQHGPFPTSRATDELVDDVRRRVGELLDTTPDGIVFGANMTSLTFHLSRALDERVGPGDEILCTQLDHDANVAPWLRLAERTGAQVRFVPLDPATGRLRTAAIDDLVTDRTRLVCFPLASNALGTVVDPGPFVAAARRVGAWTFADAVHAAPHVPVRRAASGIDVVACSPYKFFGPHAGLLAADPALLAELSPDKVRPAPDEGPERWQTGTASFEAIAGIGAAARYLAEVGFDAIVAHERSLTVRFLEGLKDLDRIPLHGPAEAHDRTPTFTITVDGRAPTEVAAHLAQEGIHVWAGHYYALEPMRALGLLDDGGGVRIGFVHYHGEADVERVLASLARL